MKSGYLAFIVDGSVEFDRLLEKIQALFHVQEEAVLRVDEQYLDTFDWRVYANGFVLRRKDTRFILAPLPGMPILETDGPKKTKLFWWDFPEGAFKDSLAAISGNRALCPVLGVAGVRRNFRVRNRDEKMVLRIHLDTGEAIVDDNRVSIAPYLCLQGVRGYPRPFQRITELLKKNGCRELQAGESFFDLTLRVIGRRPLDYKTKFSEIIETGQTTGQAISAIGLALHTLMERNLPGILEDRDTEFLHDFRVAIRRIRALLSQLKKEIPPGQAGVFEQEFKWLGSVAGLVRDLDVCLQKEAAYRDLLPESLHRGLALLMEETQRQRKARLLTMQEDLRSARAVRLLANWHDFLTAWSADRGWPAGQVPCRKVAVRVVRRCFRRLVRDASAVIQGEKQDAIIHKLRIQAKKFRYMAEFFQQFFPEAPMDALVKELRELQDDLGDFNDLAVQVRGFQQYRDALPADKTIGEALEALLLCLAAEKKRMLKRCVTQCAKFMKRDRLHLF